MKSDQITVCLVAASKIEIAPIVRGLRKVHEDRRGHLHYIYGRFAKCDVGIVLTGMGRDAALNAARFIKNELQSTHYFFSGVCGGIAPQLNTYDPFVTTIVSLIDPKGKKGPAIHWQTHGDKWEKWMDSCRLIRGELLTVPEIICHPEEKADLFQQTQALGVDLETYHLVNALNLPPESWVSVRIVSDAANDQLPTAIKQVVNRQQGILSNFVATSKLALQAGVPTMLDLKRRVDSCSTKLEAIFRRFCEIVLS